MAGHRFDGLKEIGGLGLGPGGNRAIFELQRDIGHHQPFVEEQFHPKPVALRAGAEGRVEGEKARLDFGDGEARDRTGEFSLKVMRSGSPSPSGRRGFQNGDPVGEVQGGAEGIGQPRFQPFAHHDPVNHHVDVLAEFLVERRRLFELIELAVDLDALEALLAPGR